MTLSDLSVEHDYYCSDNNYHDVKCFQNYDTFQEFYEAFKNKNVDLNLIFRWDILRSGDNYSMSIFVIKQKQGIFLPIYIDAVYESDVKDIVSLLEKHHNKLKNLWQPFKF